MKNSSSNSPVNPSTTSTSTIDFSAILRALLAKQGRITTVEKKVDDTTEHTLPTSATSLSSTSSSPPPTLQPLINSQLQSDSSSTTAAL